MKRCWGLLLIVLLLGLVTGCASKPSKYATKGYESKSEWSLARNVTEAAGLEDVADVSPEALKKGGSYLKPVPETKAGIEAGAWLATSALADFSTMSFLTMPGLTNWNAAGTADHRNESRLYAWMPREMASSPEEAKDKLDGIIREALRKGLEETEFPDPLYVPSIVPSSPYSKFVLDGKYKTRGYPIAGGFCDEGTYICRFEMAFSERTIEGPSTIVAGISPDFLGGSNAWVFSRLSTFVPTLNLLMPRSMRVKGKVHPEIPNMEAWMNMTKYLPEWAYLYLAPLSANMGGKRNEVPVIFHQGKALYFVAPDKS